MMFKLHRDETECDSDNWGPPHSVHPTLERAMAAAGHPEPADWRVYSVQCPDEVFTPPPFSDSPSWSVLGTGAAAAAMALGVADDDPLRVRHGS